MKLKLSQEKKVTTLEVTEDITFQNVSVLKAGVVKLLQTGKNRIILNLSGVQAVPMDVIQEIIKLHLTATELGGEIVLVGKGDLVKQAIVSFAKPPPIRYFSTPNAAMEALVETGDAKLPKGTLASETELLKNEIKKLQTENESLRAKLQGKKADDIKAIQKENAEIKKEMLRMEQEVTRLQKERKKPFDSASMQQRIDELEATLLQVQAQPTSKA